MNNYHLYLDYLELRRRVEKRLAHALPVVVHMTLFAIVVTVVGFAAYGGYRDLDNYYFITPELGWFAAAWSSVLLIHTLWQTVRSSLITPVRNRLIEQEMRDRLQQDEGYLSDDPKMLFRLHGMLEKDIRARSSLFVLLTSIASVNAFVWIPWALENARTSHGWITAFYLGMLVLPIVLVYNFWRSRQATRLRKELEAQSNASAIEQYESEAAFRLTDDGELVDFPIQTEGLKRKRS